MSEHTDTQKSLYNHLNFRNSECEVWNSKNESGADSASWKVLMVSYISVPETSYLLIIFMFIEKFTFNLTINYLVF